MRLQFILPLGLLGFTCGLAIPISRLNDHSLVVPSHTIESTVSLLDPAFSVSSAHSVIPRTAIKRVLNPFNPYRNHKNIILPRQDEPEDDTQDGNDLSVSTVEGQTVPTGSDIASVTSLPEQTGRTRIYTSSTSSKSHRPTVVIPPPVGTSRESKSGGKENTKPAETPEGNPPSELSVDLPDVDVPSVDLPNGGSKSDSDDKKQKKEQDRQQKQAQKEQDRQQKADDQQRKKEAAAMAADEQKKQKDEQKLKDAEQKLKDNADALKKKWENKVAIAEELYNADEISRKRYKQILYDSRQATGFPQKPPKPTPEEAMVKAHKDALEAELAVKQAAAELADAENAKLETEKNKKVKQQKKDQLKKEQQQRETADQWCESEPAPEIKSALKKGNTPWVPCQSGKFIKFDPNAKAEDAQNTYVPGRMDGKPMSAPVKGPRPKLRIGDDAPGKNA